MSFSDKPEDITFAIELKSLIRQELNTIANGDGIRPFVPHRPDESLNEVEKQLQHDNWEAIARAIDALPGVNATTSHQIRAQNLERSNFWNSHWIVYKSNSAVPPYISYEDEDSQCPLVDKTAPDYDKYVWTPVEVCSPKLLWTRKAESLSTLTRVLETLEGFTVIANHSTEVHVHVGRDDGRFYSLKTLKKLATLLWLSEPLLRGLKDPKSPNYEHKFTWSFDVRRYSRLAMALERKLPDGPTIDDLYSGESDDFDAFLLRINDARLATRDDGYKFIQEHRQALRAIWRASNHEELGRMLSGPDRKHRRLGFNFQALGREDDRSKNGPRTIEFRFLEGFIDKVIVPAWVRVVGEIVELATDKIEDCQFYDAVAFLLNLPKDWPLDARFSAFMHELRVPRWAYEPLQAEIRKNYPPQASKRLVDYSEHSKCNFF